MKTYTKEQVYKLLEEQRKNCADSATIVECNLYSESDGEILIIVDKKSIINAKIPKI